ncbi:MAG: septal ring lytic transglycosylase RlpA family protein, partial [bacterium]
GEASWYGPGFAGKKTASGERFNPNAMTAAHKSLPLGTEVQVTNLDNRESCVVRINDRGPFVRGRIIDLSKAAAKKIGVLGTGTAKVELAVLGPRERKDEDAIESKGASGLNEDASAADAIDEAVASASGKDSKQTLLASNGHYKGKGKADERPVRRNGVAYLIEQDDAAGGGAQADVEISKMAKKTKPEKRAQAADKSFKRISKNDAAKAEPVENEQLDAKSEDAKAEIDEQIDQEVTTNIEEAKAELKAPKTVKVEDADDKIAEALQKLEERKEAKAAGKDTAEIAKKERPAAKKDAKATTKKKATSKAAPKTPAKSVVKAAAKKSTPSTAK